MPVSGRAGSQSGARMSRPALTSGAAMRAINAGASRLGLALHDAAAPRRLAGGKVERSDQGARLASARAGEAVRAAARSPSPDQAQALDAAVKAATGGAARDIGGADSRSRLRTIPTDAAAVIAGACRAHLPGTAPSP